MAIIPIKELDLNKIWEKMTTPMRYVLLIAVIIAGLYFLFARKIDTSGNKQLDKISQGIDVTYQLVDKFEAFQKFQTQYNEQVIKDIQNIYTLVTELNDNVNTKFDYLIKNSGKYNEDLIDKMNLLNESFSKLSKAYQPAEKKSEVPNIEPQIGIKKIEKK